MGENTVGQLQIYAVEEIGAVSAICIVRCLGGVIYPGQNLVTEPIAGSPAGEVQVSLDWIECYGRRVDFVDPPHSARVQFSGRGLSMLAKGVTISELDGNKMDVLPGINDIS
ncbi:hypothetical protein ACFYNL_16360 [Streptomyces sp. NPDC007808]|uniref:hypothetical protein n=1 Tax=Streptomyces sp. NPDC007808 TaxID=3364779 RepID=UPI003687AC82